LQEKIVANLGWTSLRPVQDMAAFEILDGYNCVILAPTAGGKTEAAMFPVLSGCLRNQEPGLRALYISPTRALINNQEDRLGRYAQMVGLGAFKWHGDVTPARRQAFLREPLELVLTTPESLEVMLDSGRVPTAALFRNLKYVVIDEIHALAASDRGAHLLCTLERIQRYARQDFQRIGLSATVGNPEDILGWLQGSSENKAVLVDPPKVPGVKDITIVSAQEPGEVEELALASLQSCKSLLFCESRRLSERIAGSLRRQGEPVWVHHSSVSREEREEAEAQFAGGSEACIVCTSTMELGIDVGDLDKVLQVNAPSTVSSFLQRLGRTGRRPGTVANTTFIVEKDDAFLQAIALVELARSHWVESLGPMTRSWHIMLHQIMALCLERGGIGREEPEEILGKAACFSGIDHGDWTNLVEWLVTKDFLNEDGRSLSMGLEAEKVFGRRNFMELYSVFSTPVEFDVVGLAGDVIGTVEWDFIEKLLETQGAFYLSGQAWAIDRIEWKKKVVIVSKAPAGKVPVWGGMNPRFIGYEITRKKRDILTGSDDLPYLSSEARTWLTMLRSDKGPFLATAFAPVEDDEKGTRWHTWAGGRVNNTLRFALSAALGVDVQASNEVVRVSDAGVPWSDIARGIDAMACPGYWADSAIMDTIQAMLPDWRLSKFQPYLPEQKRRDLVAMTILDVPGTIRFLHEAGWPCAPSSGAPE
jgi:ATP-dependent Lhr-like helicase